MQNNIFEPQDLPDLPQPGFIDQWFLETSIIPAVILVGLGLVVFFVLRNTQMNRKVGLPALIAALVLAAGVYFLGSLIVTDREQLADLSGQLVSAAGTGDETTLRPLLDEDVRLQSVFATVTGRDEIISLSKNRAARVISSAYAGEVNAGLYGPQVARTQIRVRVEGEMLPSLSWWAVDWVRPNPDSDQWTVTHIEPIWIQGFNNPSGN